MMADDMDRLPPPASSSSSPQPKLTSLLGSLSQGKKAISFSSWPNVLLVFIPLSWAFHWAKPDSHTLIFVFSFLAIIPLAKLLAFATDKLSMRVGQTLARLLNTTLGNAIEVIVAIVSIMKCELQIVQSSLIGSILTNLLLVLGMCIFVGGLRFQGDGFGSSLSQSDLSLLTFSVISLLITGVIHLLMQSPTTGEKDFFANEHEGAAIRKLSHGIAIIILFTSVGACIVWYLRHHLGLYGGNHKYESDGTSSSKHRANENDERTEQGKKWRLTNFRICLELPVVLALISVTALFLVDSINGFTETTGLRKEWIGIFLLPIAEIAWHVTAITVSVKGKLMQSIGVAIDSSIGTALFIIPLIVVVAWIVGKPLSMLFDPLESISLFFAILTVSFVAQDRKSICLEGMALLCLYVIIAISFFFYPGSNIGEFLDQCT